eukprot:995897-Rhodomonas_salina.2
MPVTANRGILNRAEQFSARFVLPGVPGTRVVILENASHVLQSRLLTFKRQHALLHSTSASGSREHAMTVRPAPAAKNGPAINSPALVFKTVTRAENFALHFMGRACRAKVRTNTPGTQYSVWQLSIVAKEASRSSRKGFVAMSSCQCYPGTWGILVRRGYPGTRVPEYKTKDGSAINSAKRKTFCLPLKPAGIMISYES